MGRRFQRKFCVIFPLLAYWKDFYSSRHTAKEMRWHEINKSNKDGIKSLSDGKAWSNFDATFLEFVKESRNVQLGLASSSFNPFGTTSFSYSMWLVLLIPYNMPPWRSMKEEYFMMTSMFIFVCWSMNWSCFRIWESRHTIVCLKKDLTCVLLFCGQLMTFLRMGTYLVRVPMGVKHVLPATMIQLLFVWGTSCRL